jgi:AcrR family transcriptional regulator
MRQARLRLEARMTSAIRAQKKQVRLNGAARLDEICKVAARMICEKGYDGTSMSEIASAVGITKAGIYHHIEGKRELLFAIMSYGMDSLYREVIVPARAIEDPELRLRTIITNHARLITSNSGPQGNNPVTILVDETAGLMPAHRRKVNQRKRSYVDMIRHTLTQLKDQQKLRDVDVTAAAFSLLGMIIWLSRWYNPQGRLTPDEVAADISSIALGGLLRC